MTTAQSTRDEPRHNDETIKREPMDLRCTFDAGAQAMRAGINAADCPYPRASNAYTRRHRRAWLGGWWAQHDDN